MIDYAYLRTKTFAERGCPLCAAALAAGATDADGADRHHPREVVNTIACVDGGKSQRVGWRVGVRNGERLLEFTSPVGGLPWYSYYCDSLDAGFARRPDACEFVLCDGAGGSYSRVTVNANTIRKILAEFAPTHPMFAA